VLLLTTTRRQKVIAVTQRLDENEGAIEYERDDRSEYKLRRAEGRAGRADSVIRQDHREDCERRKHGQSGARSPNLETLLVMPHATPQQAQAYNAVANDHDHREYRISREARFVS
jgi:hypothetical protein